MNKHKKFDKKRIVDINVHRLTPKNIPDLGINREFINEQNGFWRNDAINAWCLGGRVVINKYPVCDETEYWLGVYDRAPKGKAAKIEVRFDCFSGICTYLFDSFFNPKEIDDEDEYQIQKMFIKEMNRLIDMGAFIVPWEQKAN